MTTELILESEMEFGPYPEGHCFYIEKSAVYRNIKNNGVKISEFLLLRSNTKPIIWIVEAKSSSPQRGTEEFNAFIQAICEKFINALTLYLATYLKRHACSELPDPFQAIDLGKAEFTFILVMKKHPEEALAPLKDVLNFALKPTAKTWNLPPIYVLVFNEAMARARGLIR